MSDRIDERTTTPRDGAIRRLEHGIEDRARAAPKQTQSESQRGLRRPENRSGSKVPEYQSATTSTAQRRGSIPTSQRGKSTRPKRHLPPEVLTDAEVCALIRACGRFCPTGLRNRALIALLYRTGLRINEALSLYPKDLDLDDGSVRVLNGKGGRARTVGLDPGPTAIIERWLDARSRCLALALAESHDVMLSDTKSLHAAQRDPIVWRAVFGRHPVFCTLRGGPMADSYIRVMLKRLATRAGIEKRVHAHGLRHTHAAQLRAEGIDIAIISRQLGHASINTTAIYLDHLAPRAVIEAIRNRIWTSV